MLLLFAADMFRMISAQDLRPQNSAHSSAVNPLFGSRKLMFAPVKSKDRDQQVIDSQRETTTGGRDSSGSIGFDFDPVLNR